MSEKISLDSSVPGELDKTVYLCLIKYESAI